MALTNYRRQREWLLEDFDGPHRNGGRGDGALGDARHDVPADRSPGHRPAGQEISKGDWVVTFYQSANHDESAFERPWDFDLSRDPNPHLGFGGGGPHFCLGYQLAKTQLRTIFKELLTRVPNFEVADPVYLRSNFIDGIKSMRYRLNLT